jgi:hypothetical protein
MASRLGDLFRSAVGFLFFVAGPAALLWGALQYRKLSEIYPGSIGSATFTSIYTAVLVVVLWTFSRNLRNEDNLSGRVVLEVAFGSRVSDGVSRSRVHGSNDLVLCGESPSLVYAGPRSTLPSEMSF